MRLRGVPFLLIAPLGIAAALTAHVSLCLGRRACWAALIALVAGATLFGMEYAESGNAALGLGWLGGDFVYGTSALVAAIVAAVGALYLAIVGHFAGFDRLVALLAAALARLAATLLAPTPVPQSIAVHRLRAHPAPVARHAGLRAPPLTAR